MKVKKRIRCRMILVCGVGWWCCEGTVVHRSPAIEKGPVALPGRAFDLENFSVPIAVRV